MLTQGQRSLIEQAVDNIENVLNQRIVVKPQGLSKEEWENYKEVTDNLTSIVRDLDHVEDV